MLKTVNKKGDLMLSKDVYFNEQDSKFLETFVKTVLERDFGPSYKQWNVNSITIDLNHKK